jgi:hypothetical protein
VREQRLLCLRESDVAVAECHLRKWKRNHYEKAELASQLAREGIIRTDVRETLLQLNNLRKDISYGEPGRELADADLDTLVADLGSFVEEVETIVIACEDISDRQGRLI